MDTKNIDPPKDYSKVLQIIAASKKAELKKGDLRRLDLVYVDGNLACVRREFV